MGISAEDKNLLNLKLKEVLGEVGDGKKDAGPDYCHKTTETEADFVQCMENGAGAAMVTERNAARKHMPASSSTGSDKPTIEAYPNVDAMGNYVGGAN